MSDSVFRAIGYGWNVGVCLVHKMSEKIFDSRNAGDEDGSFATEKEISRGRFPFMSLQTSESVNDLGNNLTEASDGNSEAPIKYVENEHGMRSKTDPDLTRSETTQPTILHFDSLDETSHKLGMAKPKGLRSNDGNGKLGYTKNDNRSRSKAADARSMSDFRYNHAGNGNPDPRWLQHEKLEKSQNDLTNSKWINSNADNSKYDFNSKSHCYTSNSSESDIFSSRSMISSHPNESSCPRPPPLFKSSSSSQLPCIRSNYLQSSRQQWRYGNNSTTRPISVVSMQQTFVPMPPSSLYSQQGYPKNCCGCCESSSKKNGRAESVLSLADDPETPEGLSWRRLHMSRAKLKATATTSELLSGFAMVAMVELQINKPTAVPEWLFVMFAVCTTVLVSVHIFALMISTYLLPNIDAVSKLHVSSLVTESPHDRMKGFIELAWAFSTILGLFLFLVEIAILCWVKFWDYSFTAAMSATMIVIPVLVVFVAFAMHFYHSLVVIKCKTSVSNMQELENMKKQLDNVSPV